jgi:hypothetical protein
MFPESTKPNEGAIVLRRKNPKPRKGLAGNIEVAITKLTERKVPSMKHYININKLTDIEVTLYPGNRPPLIPVTKGFGIKHNLLCRLKSSTSRERQVHQE